MLSYLIRRILLFFPTLIGATAVIFLLMALSPISIVDVLLPPGGAMRPGERAAREAYIQERYGLGDPAFVQYLHWLNNISPVGFRTWTRDDPEVVQARQKEAQLRAERERAMAAGGAKPDEVQRATKAIVVGPNAGELRLNRPAVKAPDMGDSFIQSRPVWPIIKEALPVTLTLELLSVPLSLAIALVSGIWAAKHRGKVQDVATGTLLLALYAVPTIWVGTLMVGFLANVHYVKAFPAEGLHDMRAAAMPFFPRFEGGFQRGYMLDTAWHLLLPVVCISYGTFAYYSKLTRTALLETLGTDFVRTARAKGLSERVVLFRHAFRNSLLPLITVAASFLPVLVTGSIVVETIFGINGMGRLTIAALKANDRELFLSTSVIILLLQLGGYLLADILYAVADPRVSYDNR
jgi:ABC-type dipeptide/oligopeptide/nickel transport system permease component